LPSTRGLPIASERGTKRIRPLTACLGAVRRHHLAEAGEAEVDLRHAAGVAGCSKAALGMAPVSNQKFSYILSAIALLILLVACINFVTLSVGRSLQRAKEVGIRKVVGAMQTQLITQFIGEAILVTLIAMIMGVGLSYLN